MRILFLAPLPPPITGHSLASEVLRDGLVGSFEVDVVDIGRDSTHSGGLTAKRIRATIDVLRQVWKRRARADVVYLTISQSVAGNLKDLLIYLLCAGRLERTCIHLHGGSIKRELFDRHPTIRALNARFIKRMGAVIVTGTSHLEIFDGLIDRERIHIVPNFAETYLFLDDAQMTAKWSRTRPLKLLFMSGMRERKGYVALTDAYFALAPAIRDRVQIDFAGAFESADEAAAFATRIAGTANLRYHGVVQGAEKQRLFAEAHVFCLPSMYAEGQPISILEAYASGCVVLATGQPGILDIFDPDANGFEVMPGSVESIRVAIEKAVDAGDGLSIVAARNRTAAREAYTTPIYSSAIAAVLRSIGGPVSAPVRGRLDGRIVEP